MHNWGLMVFFFSFPGFIWPSVFGFDHDQICAKWKKPHVLSTVGWWATSTLSRLHGGTKNWECLLPEATWEWPSGVTSISFMKLSQDPMSCLHYWPETGVSLWFWPSSMQGVGKQSSRIAHPSLQDPRSGHASLAATIREQCHLQRWSYVALMCHRFLWEMKGLWVSQRPLNISQGKVLMSALPFLPPINDFLMTCAYNILHPSHYLVIEDVPRKWSLMIKQYLKYQHPWPN